MALVTGHEIINGIPYINGKPAEKDENQSEFMAQMFSPWKCPECGAYLAKDSLICLNACHLSAASYKRFSDMLADAVGATAQPGNSTVGHHTQGDKIQMRCLSCKGKFERTAGGDWDCPACGSLCVEIV